MKVSDPVVTTSMLKSLMEKWGPAKPTEHPNLDPRDKDRESRRLEFIAAARRLPDGDA